MNKIYILSFLFFCYFGWQKFGPSFFKNDLLPKNLTFINEEEVQKCFNRKKCAVVYIAPWCPACESITPILQNFVQKNQVTGAANLANPNSVNDLSVGFVIIIGAGNSEQNQQKYKSFSSNALVDENMKIAKALKISYYPTFLMIENTNSQKKITMRDQVAFNWMQEHFK